jgi:hypothetical protein
MKSKINNSWLPLPTPLSAAHGVLESGVNERGTHVGKENEGFHPLNLQQKLKLTYLVPVTLLSTFQHLLLVFFARTWAENK